MATPLKISPLSEAEKTKETEGPKRRHKRGMGRVSEGLSSAHELTAFVDISRLLPMCAFTEHLTLRRVEKLLTPKDESGRLASAWCCTAI